MESELQTRIEEYVARYANTLQKVGNEQAAAVIIDNAAKDIRAKQIVESRSSSQPKAVGPNGDNEAATWKQLKKLGELGVKEIPAGISKAKASELIDQAKVVKVAPKAM